MARPEVTGRRVRALTDDELGEGDAYSIAEFCKRHRISLPMFYKLAQRGLGPKTFNVGTRVLISKEAAARWRREREAATAAEVNA